MRVACYGYDGCVSAFQPALADSTHPLGWCCYVGLVINVQSWTYRAGIAWNQFHSLENATFEATKYYDGIFQSPAVVLQQGSFQILHFLCANDLAAEFARLIETSPSKVNMQTIIPYTARGLVLKMKPLYYAHMTVVSEHADVQRRRSENSYPTDLPRIENGWKVQVFGSGSLLLIRDRSQNGGTKREREWKKVVTMLNM